MEPRSKQVIDIPQAAVMAAAEAPYREKIISERRMGATATRLNQLQQTANRISRMAGKNYEARAKREAWENAYDAIIEQSETPVLTKDMFMQFWGSGAGLVWHSLVKGVQKDDRAPLEVVPLVEDEVALKGDFVTAAWGYRLNASGQALQRFVDYLSTENGKLFLESQGLPADLFTATSDTTSD